MIDARLTISGIQELQAENNRMRAQLRPTGALGEAVQYVTNEAHRYAVSIVHVDTGALRASQLADIDGLRGQVYTSPNTTNPRSGARPVEYAEDEHERGGEHAFYDRTVAERGPVLLERAEQIVWRGLGL